MERKKGSSRFETRKIKEVEGGYYADDGFYYLPDGSNLTKI